MSKRAQLLANLHGNQVLTLVALGSFLGGVLLTGIIATVLQAQEPATGPRALRESDIATSQADYQFIDPLITIRGNNDPAKYVQMQKEVEAYVASQEKEGLMIASVGVRDINEPGGFTLNPAEKYTPASLYKVPVMMAYYKIAEAEPEILSHSIWYEGASDRNEVQEIRSPVQLTPGMSYTVEELIEHMIRYSDNNATNLLLKHLDETRNGDVYISVFSDLGIDPNVLREYADNVTVSNYLMFLRSLYNATYLSRAGSEKALKLLSETDFTQGITHGVPEGMLIAQKFGEVRMTTAAGTFLGKQINNCGIIYYPLHPYLLCVMTKQTGDDIPALEARIAAISRIVYQNMQRLYP